MFLRCRIEVRFHFIPIRVPFSFPTVFRWFSCRHRVNRRPFRNDFVPFQVITASCERSLIQHAHGKAGTLSKKSCLVEPITEQSLLMRRNDSTGIAV